jgi:hypothetical protein
MRGFFRVTLVAAVAAVTLLLVAPAAQAARAPALAWSPVANGGFSFAPVPPGQTPSQTFTLTNSGGSSTAMLTEALSGSAAFALTSDRCTGTALGPRKSCTVTVGFTPTQISSGGNATLTTTAQKVSLAGASFTLGPPGVHLSPGDPTGVNSEGTSGYSCTSMLVGGCTLVSGVAQTFTVTNDGYGLTFPLRMASIGPNADRFAVSNDTCTLTVLVPLGSCTFDLTFTAPSPCTPGSGFSIGDIEVLDLFDIFGGVKYIELDADQDCPSGPV